MIVRPGWLGRTFGWSGSRSQWLNLLGAVGWLAGFAAIAGVARTWSVGEVVLALAGWCLVLGLVAREAVRDMFGPVFFYEVVRAGRQRITFVVRFLYVAGICAVLGLMYSTWLDERNYRSELIDAARLSQFATGFFETFVVIQFCAMLLLTPVYVAGCIAVEKERKTLEFLLATDLRNREIIFGKLAARVVTLVMYVLAGLPLIALLQLFGGIDPQQLLAATAATIIVVIGVSAVAIWVSVTVRKARDAIVLTYMLVTVYGFVSFLMAVLTIAPLGLGWWTDPVKFLGVSVGIDDLCLAFAAGNPLWAVMRLSSTAFAGQIGDVLREFAIFWAVATGLMLGIAIARLRAVALTQSYGPVRSAKPRADGKPAKSSRPPLGDNPVFWKEVFVDGGSRGSWLSRVINVIIVLLIFVPLVIIIWEIYYSRPGRRTPVDQWRELVDAVNAWVRGVTGIIGALLFFSIAIRGSAAVSGEKDRDTWISLIGTPLSSDAILRGKWWGCVLGARKPYVVLLIVWSVGLSIGAVSPLMLPVMIGLTAIYVSAFAWIGLYCSMTARNTLVASVRAFFAALFFAGGFWIVAALCCFLPMSHSSGRESEGIATFFAGLTPPFVLGWAPMHSFDRWQLGIFHPRENALGPAAPVFGTLLWLLFNVLLAVGSLSKFRELTNRTRRREPEERQPHTLRTAFDKPST